MYTRVEHLLKYMCWNKYHIMPTSDIVTYKRMFSLSVVYIRTKDNTANNSEEKEILRKYIAWNFERHHRENPEVMVMVLMDMAGASTGNVVSG